MPPGNYSTTTAIRYTNGNLSIAEAPDANSLISINPLFLVTQFEYDWMDSA